MRHAVISFALLVGCGSTQEQNEPAVDPVADTGPESSTSADAGSTRFGACPAGYSGACATLEAPLDHDVDDGKTVHLLVNRISSSPHAKAQLWMLAGGPGGSGADLTTSALSLGPKLDGFDIYTLDHRGVGASDRLSCGDEPKDADKAALDTFYLACAKSLQDKWGVEGLARFSTTMAARDLGWVIDRVRGPGQKVYVYGVSYGTLWAQRYLQVRGEQPDGVILDSVVLPAVNFFPQFEHQFDDVAKKLAEQCKADASCRARLGADPWATVQGYAAKVKAGSCAGAPATTMSSVTLLIREWGVNTLAFAVLHRYARCTATDVAALKKLDEFIRGATANPRFSLALQFNVAFSELWESPAPSEAELRARADAQAIPANMWTSAVLQAGWPKYALDAFFGKTAATDKPMLMLGGTLDAQTPIELARTARDRYAAPGQLFVEVPNATHSVLTASPMADPAKGTCGEQMIVSWLASEGKTTDTSCADHVPAPPWAVNGGLVRRLLGTDDAWDDVTSAPSAAKPAPPSPDLPLMLGRAGARAF